MSTSNEYDRLATQEELQQVLQILCDLERTEPRFFESSPGPETNSVWEDALADNSGDAPLLYKPIEKTPELKN